MIEGGTGVSYTILVTGATGTVGTEVVKQLSAKGADVRACCHTLGRADKIRGPGVEIVEVDYDKPETVEAAFKGVEKLFLLTPLVDNMVEMTAQLVAEATKAGVKHIVKLSTIDVGADAEARIPPIRWHRQAERIVEESGIPYTFLRPTSGWMQNFSNFYVQTIEAQNAIYTAAGEGKQSLVDARDMAAVAVEALTGDGHEGKVYSVSGPEAISHNQIAEVLSEVLGRKITHVSVSEEDARKGFEEAGFPDWMVNSGIEGDRLTREGRLSAVSPTVEEVTGRKPRSFGQYARDYAEAFR